MKEQFVTYEIALGLKELGFDEKCFGRYEQPDWKDIRLEITNTSSQNLFSWQLSSAPLWQQAVSFLNKLLIEWGYYEDNDLYIWEDFTNLKILEVKILKAIELCQKK